MERLNDGGNLCALWTHSCSQLLWSGLHSQPDL
jgi:hypothetical protein